MPRRGDEDMGEVLADAAPGGEGLRPRCRVRSASVVEGDVARARARISAMQQVERRRASAPATSSAKARERRVGAGQRGLAQEDARREALDRAAHDAGGVLGLDLARRP